MAFQRLRRLLSSAYEPSNLLYTNVAASGGLLFLGDIIQQNIELFRETHETGSYDYSRSARMLGMGLFHGAPRHFFYLTLEKRIPGSSFLSAAKKVFFDQAVLSVFIDSTFLFGMTFLEGDGVKASWSNMLERFPMVYMYDNMLWPPVQMVNFTMVPSRFRVLYVNIGNLVWNTILSFAHHRSLGSGRVTSGTEQGN